MADPPARRMELSLRLRHWISTFLEDSASNHFECRCEAPDSQCAVRAAPACPPDGPHGRVWAELAPVSRIENCVFVLPIEVYAMLLIFALAVLGISDSVYLFVVRPRPHSLSTHGWWRVRHHAGSAYILPLRLSWRPLGAQQSRGF